MAKKPSTSHAALIRMLTDRLAETRPEEVVSYAEMEALCGVDFRKYHLSRARKVVNEESGALFRPVYRVGIQRLQPDEAPVAAGTAALSRIRGHARRSRVRIVNAITQSNSISDESVVKGYAMVNIFGLLEASSHFRSIGIKQAEITQRHGGSTASAAASSLEAMRLSVRGPR